MQRKNIVLYMCFVFLTNFTLFASFESVFLGELKALPLAGIAALFMTYQLTKLIFEIPTGYVADRFGLKKSALLGLVLILCYYAMLLFGGSEKWYLICAYVVKGVGYTLISGSIEALFVNGLEPDTLTRYNGIERLVMYVSIASAAVLAGCIIAKDLFKRVLLIDMCTICVTLVVTLMMRETRGPEAGERISPKKVWDFLRSTDTCLLPLGMDFATAFCFMEVEELYSKYLTELGVGTALIGVFIACQLVAAAACGSFTYKLTEKIRPEKLVAVCPFLFLALMMCVFLSATPVWLKPVLYTLSQATFALYAPIKYTIFQRSIVPEYRATVISVQSQCIALGGVASYLLTALLSHWLALGHILLLLGAGTCLCFLSLVPKLVSRAKLRQLI
ncbi:MAG: MFS transporter [Oscillospiraceae bacterium]|jgi:predicted MFS family arabinose efflux permease